MAALICGKTPSGGPPRRAASPRRAFTLIELVVVVTIILIVLLIAVPGLSSMSREARFNSALTAASGMMSRAQLTAVAEANAIAVRVMPGVWDRDENRDAQRPAGRQHLVMYSYRSEPIGQQGSFVEFFARKPGVDSLMLPADIWAAPVEAVAKGPQGLNFVNGLVVGGSPVYPPLLNGRLADHGGSAATTAFWYDARDTGDFCNADDFLIVFDPQSGLRIGTPTPFLLRGTDGLNSAGSFETLGLDPVDDPFVRYNFTGLTFYQREAYRALDGGPSAPAAGAVRQVWLRTNSRPFFVHRRSGSLVAGVSEAP